MSALHALLRGSIDYAGLFPPAGLGMAEAVANYASYRAGTHAWALGRFVLPASRLGEFESAAESACSPRARAPSPWRDRRAARHRRRGRPPRARRVQLPPRGRRRRRRRGRRRRGRRPTRRRRSSGCWSGYRRTSRPTSRSRSTGDPARARRRPSAGPAGRAKVRTGGITADAFPPADRPRPLHPRLPRRRRALQGDRRTAPSAPRRLPAHLRARQRLRHHVRVPESLPRGRVHGAADVDDAGRRALLLEERDRRAAPLRCRRRRVAGPAARPRRDPPRLAKTGIVSFGSCSFTEPIGDLQSLGTALARRGRHPRSIAPLLGRVGQPAARLSDSEPAVRRLPTAGQDEPGRVGIAIGGHDPRRRRLPREGRFTGLAARAVGGVRGPGTQRLMRLGAASSARSCAGR